MNRCLHIAFSGILLLFAGCTRIDEQSPAACLLQDMTFICSLENNSSKTALCYDNIRVFWSGDDSVKIFKGNRICGKFTNMNSDVSQTSMFVGFLSEAKGGDDSIPYYGVYPYSEQSTYSSEGVMLTIPAIQKAVRGSFDPTSFPSIGKSATSNMSFFNVCGGLRIKLASPGIRSITFEGHNDETLAGNVTLDFNPEGKPSVIRVNKAESKVTLVCEESFIPGEWYYISMLPSHLSSGFSITLGNGLENLTFYSNSASSIERSEFGQLEYLSSGLSFNNDWKNNEFTHHSLFLCFPDCAFSGTSSSPFNAFISSAATLWPDKVETALLLANGPGSTEVGKQLLAQVNQSNVPFNLTDYRMATGNADSVLTAYSETEARYGTVSGISLTTEFDGDILQVKAKLHLKERGSYRLVILVTEDGTSYPVTLYSGAAKSTVPADRLVRCAMTDAKGDPVSAMTDNDIKNLQYSHTIPGEFNKDKLRVLAYVLNPYGEKAAVTNSYFGLYYVDNAISVCAGESVGLSTRMSLQTAISSYRYDTEISF